MTSKGHNFGFDEVTPRRGTNSVKWDTPADEGVLPMWIADMDFKAAPVIREALQRRLDHGVFGYTKVPQAYYDAVTNWFSRRHGWNIDPDSILYTIGVVPALSTIIKAVTRPGDKVLVQTPVYNCFFSSIRNNDCITEELPLVCSDNGYTVDFEAFERAAADPQVTLFILCNPHNPGGRVWSRDELRRMGEICLRHDVFVASDEIHCELTFDGHRYTPYATLGEEFARRSASCISPTKAFNIAGLQIANIVAADADVRSRIDRAINIFEVCDVNPFGVEALIAAYNGGEEWLEALKEYIRENYLFMCGRFAEHLPHYRIMPLEGSYLAWVDCRHAALTAAEIVRQLEHDEKLMLNAGTMYGAAGEGFIRVNLACPRSVLADGVERMRRVLEKL
ncbi:MAG: pyridoxal phosphate-dependent aminotransferase [Alistipes sp.]|nr:pyridoxal phosphate-dependent aminotransferase [Alistipes sp.]